MKLMDTSHIDVLGLMCSFYYSCSKIEYNNTTVVVNAMRMHLIIMHNVMCMGTRTVYMHVFHSLGIIIAIIM